MSTANSVGVIGGADGPTAIFVATSPFPVAALVLCAVVVVVVLCLLFTKNKKK